MGKNICEKCHKIFANKRNLLRHLNSCKIGSKTNKQIKFKCKKCGRYFARKDSLTRHINTKICNKKKNNVIKGNKNEQINAKNNANGIVTSASNIIKSPNSNVYNVNLIVFAKDGIKNISPKDLSQILKSNNNVIESIISNVNLNPQKPQHHNIYYSDTKSTYGEVYENNTWVRKKIDEILETLINAKIDDLNEILNDMGDFLNKKSREKIRNAIENMDYTRPGARKKLKTYLKPILYNHKDMIIKTRKLTKEQIEENFKKEQQEAEIEAQLEEEELRLKKILGQKRK
jgi:uncharacterized C2H2 Zn-finger protein